MPLGIGSNEKLQKRSSANLSRRGELVSDVGLPSRRTADTDDTTGNTDPTNERGRASHSSQQHAYSISDTDRHAQRDRDDRTYKTVVPDRDSYA